MGSIFILACFLAFLAYICELDSFTILLSSFLMFVSYILGLEDGGYWKDKVDDFVDWIRNFDENENEE